METATEGRGRPRGDEALLAAVATGDARASEGLYDRLAGVVDHALVRVLGRREPDHDDLVQATFERIVSTLSRPASTRSCSLSSWACHIATRVGLDALRAHPRDVDRLRSLLASMSPEEAETVLLHDLWGHDLAEIARLAGVRVATAQSRLARARQRLQSTLVVPAAGQTSNPTGACLAPP
jgi:DNA-directed RNA polymerase specialized sigma24 family protein